MEHYTESTLEVIDVVRELTKMGLTEISIRQKRDVLVFNLNTSAKSGLELGEDWIVETRYNPPETINKNQPMERVITDLFWKFLDCKCGREYHNNEWMEIGVQLGLVHKQVETITKVTYL